MRTSRKRSSKHCEVRREGRDLKESKVLVEFKETQGLMVLPELWDLRVRRAIREILARKALKAYRESRDQKAILAVLALKVLRVCKASLDLRANKVPWDRQARKDHRASLENHSDSPRYILPYLL